MSSERDGLNDKLEHHQHPWQECVFYRSYCRLPEISRGAVHFVGDLYFQFTKTI